MERPGTPPAPSGLPSSYPEDPPSHGFSFRGWAGQYSLAPLCHLVRATSSAILYPTAFMWMPSNSQASSPSSWADGQGPTAWMFLIPALKLKSLMFLLMHSTTAEDREASKSASLALGLRSGSTQHGRSNFSLLSKIRHFLNKKNWKILSLFTTVILFSMTSEDGVYTTYTALYDVLSHAMDILILNIAVKLVKKVLHSFCHCFT